MKLKVGVLCGGRSGEHEVSLKSAASIIGALDKEKYDITPIGITRGGTWFTGDNIIEDLSQGKSLENNDPIAIIPDPKAGGFIRLPWKGKGRQASQEVEKLEVVFPVLHGPYGEDGTVQGLLELAGIPYVGPGVLAASAGMDKVIMKMVFQQRGLPVGKYLYFLRKEWARDREFYLDKVEKELGYPSFIKPCNLGSSVGISKAKNREELIQGIEEAGRYDRKIVIEEYIPGREIEVSVLGNDEPLASVPGEVVPSNEFYDYRAKYLDDRSLLYIPAELESSLAARVQDMAVESFKALDGSGMGRVDFFVEEERKRIIINEINTIPGFTQVSMYPKLWEASGVSYQELLDRLINLARERFKEREQLKTTVDL
ncbi:MAG: D-alanine--D-alanine ligase [Candidatus Syntrophonatronum acetioxidans]|uniref:D-alanine--D-alanine ligase n=1 Tax=Candidatus Syntrophonatronum acetioxidans TaxID=1795816 RepID=A0A424YAZ2_9FIRM|nr:MAG: D-alanine--D-alanine ligase [Candidatus Syntrophonatronum acetioxidans]